MRAGTLRAPHQIDADLVVVARDPIELEPEDIARDLADPLDRATADTAERIGNARALRGLGQA